MKTIIYGGAGGIGSALARRLAAAGRPVHLVGRSEAALAALAEETGATVTVGDVLDNGLFSRVMEDVQGPVSGLAYAIGSINLKPVSRLTEADFLMDFRLNALGAAEAAKAALPRMKEAEGTPSILFFSTVAVAQGFAAHASVSMAKGAVEGLTRALAAELAPKIRVNCIAPSLTRTNMAKALTSSDSMAAAIAQLHPMQRLGEADDSAALGAFLLSPDAGWITGQIIGADGGRSSLRTKG
jgi:NAD(P)-dependent dehydrogenase (short-subunit alcohol dehydrogenase family)